ncbi:MAG: DUF3343 domain-containing protein [Heliobacteriaceae bacterium]|nr:DUF3343 domain-containing protein [Heliobacteriaceae bacterium]MDD4588252.1 DUF3343 domain-containing protein [Heliobacteriaceae bacterium]
MRRQAIGPEGLAYDAVLLLHSTHRCLRADAILKARGNIPYLLCQAPRQITTSCEYVIRLPQHFVPDALAACTEQGLNDIDVRILAV